MATKTHPNKEAWCTDRASNKKLKRFERLEESNAWHTTRLRGTDPYKALVCPLAT